ncbi:MAG: YicC/YloC family endoribonuclease [Methylocella sp.]
MTGFARAAGSAGPWHLAWELKSVNAKGLEARLRVAPPFDALEPDAQGGNPGGQTKAAPFLFVKVREDWLDDPERYREMGLEFPKD